MSSRVGAFGDEVAITPNLDQLATEGVRYTNMFTSAGVCAPSRAALITGMHQIAIGAQHMRSSNGPTGGYRAVPPAQVKAFPELLRRAGYYTWTDWKLDYQFSGGRSGTGPFTIWSAEGRKAHWRNRAGGQPFFGLKNFLATHESGIFSKLGSWPNGFEHFLMQVMRAISLPSVAENDPVAPEDVVVPPYFPDTASVRAAIARHYNNIALMDRQVGEVLTELQEDGLAESTIIIWTTDHGDGLPRAKRELFDSGLKVPMIIRWPEAYRPKDVAPNSVDARLLSFVDLAPTILSLAGVTLPDYLHGKNILTAQREHIFASRDRIDEIADRQRAVRSTRYKYIRSWHPGLAGGHTLDFRDNINMVVELRRLFDEGRLNAVQRQWFEPPGEERLFDIVDDPYELNNLASDPAHQPALLSMRGALSAWQQRVADWSELPESEMFEQFYPRGEQPETAPPEFLVQEGKVSLRCPTEGASIGYRINRGAWSVYTAPIELESGNKLQAKAVRYGFKESEVATLAAAALIEP